MRSNYKKIGEHIQLVDERNEGLTVQQLLGLSITKQFIPSVANIIGTDMENYKIIRKNQFACSTMQVRRDKKMPVALLQEVDEAIISQAYPIFEVKDEKELLPEYLMMWFTRSEFDREACFNAVGGVRGSLEWEDFCEMQFPIPSPAEQKEIVKEYNTILNRINLNKQLIQKLEETAQAIYKQWFVDFEFPDENGLPYKSNGREMVFNEKLEKEIPKGWEVKVVDDIVKCNISILTPKDKFETIEYLDTSSITNNEIAELQTLNLMEDEIPYQTTVLVRAYEEKTTLTKITADIIVQRESQKAILIGDKGNMIKKIGTLSRQDIEKFIDQKVFLELFVKVKEKWRDNELYLKEYGY